MGKEIRGIELLANCYYRCSSLLLDLPRCKSLHFSPSGKCFTAILCSAKSLLDINVPSCGLNEPCLFSTSKKYRKTTDPILFQHSKHLCFPLKEAWELQTLTFLSVHHRRWVYQMTSVLTIATIGTKANYWVWFTSSIFLLKSDRIRALGKNK